MKKILTLPAILFLFTIANGQVTKGSFLIGLQASKTTTTTDYTYSNGSGSSQSGISNNLLVFSVGEAFKDNEVLGASIGYLPNASSSSIYLGGSSSTGNASNYGGNIYYRKYKKILPSLYSYCELGAGLEYSHQPFVNAYTGYFYLTPGVSYRIHKGIDVEILIPNLVRLFYNITKTTNYIYYQDQTVVSSNTVNNGNGTYTTTYTYADGPTQIETKTTTPSTFGLSTSLSLSSFAAGVRIIL